MEQELGVPDGRFLSKIVPVSGVVVSVIFGLLLYFNYGTDPEYFQRWAAGSGTVHHGNDFATSRVQSNTIP